MMSSNKKLSLQVKKFLVILGEGRFDSPGKSAKYCTYTCQSPVTKKIIATSTIQTSKGKSSAPLELQGFMNCLHDLESNGFAFKSIATDRNSQIAKWLRENQYNISLTAGTFLKTSNQSYENWSKEKAAK